MEKNENEFDRDDLENDNEQDEIAKLRADKSEAIAKKKAWREKWEKEREARLSLEERLKQGEPDTKKPEEKATPQFDPAELEERVELRVGGYTKDEIDLIAAVARGKGVKLSEVKSDPFVLAGIEGLRKNKEVGQATPSPSERTVVVTPESKDVTKMSDAELRNKWKETLEKKAGKTQQKFD